MRIVSKPGGWCGALLFGLGLLAAPALRGDEVETHTERLETLLYVEGVDAVASDGQAVVPATPRRQVVAGAEAHFPRSARHPASRGLLPHGTLINDVEVRPVSHATCTQTECAATTCAKSPGQCAKKTNCTAARCEKSACAKSECAKSECGAEECSSGVAAVEAKACGACPASVVAATDGTATACSAEQKDCEQGRAVAGATCRSAGCEAKRAVKDRLPVRPNETAKVILELMETLGRSVLDGTEFQHAEELQTVFDAAPVSTRDALVQLIRSLEAEREACEAAGACATACEEEIVVDRPPFAEFVARSRAEAAPHHHHEAPPIPAGRRPWQPAWDGPGWGMGAVMPPPPMHAMYAASNGAYDNVAALRSTSELLDQEAAGLEHRRLFEQADQLRELAQRLRQQARELDARRAGRVADKWNDVPTYGEIHFGR